MRTLSTLCVAALLSLTGCYGEEVVGPEIELPTDEDGAEVEESVETETGESGASSLADTAKTALEGVSEGAGDYVSQAETLLAEVQGFLAASNVDKAKLSLSKLEGLQDKLPADWAQKIDSVRSTLAVLEAKGVKIPDLGGVKLPGSDG